MTAGIAVSFIAPSAFIQKTTKHKKSIKQKINTNQKENKPTEQYQGTFKTTFVNKKIRTCKKSSGISINKLELTQLLSLGRRVKKNLNKHDNYLVKSINNLTILQHYSEYKFKDFHFVIAGEILHFKMH